ncbi:HAMP domain-containing sensor histidine kinase [Micromonospora sp. NPDC049523]|uniref:sensor histidine kinase n=1 Tax=Micromonospora sp. NPDC049523 TaxID=3155921 RepID=UPI003446FACD
MRRRLTLLVAATMCLVLLAFLVPLAVLLRRVAVDRATNSAVAAVQSVAALVGSADPDALRFSVEQVAAESHRPVTVFLADGSVLGTPAPRTDAVTLAARGRSVTVDRPDGREVVVAVQRRPGETAVIRTFVTAAELDRGVRRAWLLLAALGATLLLLGLVVADRLARALVRPIAELSAVSHRLARADLSARATPTGPPELREVAGALNHLAGRIQELLRDEREQVADLSHRLRTPLTALRLESEALTDRAEAARITAAVDALERAVTGLIRQARRYGPTGADGWCDAAPVVLDRVEFWSVLAEETGRTITSELVAGPLPVRLPTDELAALVDALLGNIFAHTPDGTGFSVTLVPRAGGGAVLTVADHGPGLPRPLVEPGRTDTGAPADASVDAGPVATPVRRGGSFAGSTGLGLDIADRAARDSGGALHLADNAEGGARIRVELGPPPSDPA